MSQQAATAEASTLGGSTSPWTEDWLAVAAGLVVFLLALALLFGGNLLGWATAPRTWLEIGKSVRPASPAYAQLEPAVLLLITYGFVLVLMTIGAALLRRSIVKFVVSFTVVFWLSYLCWVLGNYAYIAVTTPAEMQRLGMAWSLRLTGEFGYVAALLVGLAIANLTPALANWLNEAARPELYIKTAIVILGGTVGVKAAEQLGLASSVMWRGLAAIIEAYLIYWAVVYFVARKWFGFSREWAAPLASGISICGVSAAIATAGAIRARPMVAVMVSSLVVVFAMVELLVLPFAARTFLGDQPLVAAAWMGLAVKTDGAAVASGAITEALIYADAAAQGIKYDKGWIVGTTTTIKIFIDIFIGIWAFILAYIWARHIEPRRPGDELRWRRNLGAIPEIRAGLRRDLPDRLADRPELQPSLAEDRKRRHGSGQRVPSAVLRPDVLLDWTDVGSCALLWQEGIARLAAVYVVSLFGFVIWVGLLISWIFFHGLKPPIAG